MAENSEIAINSNDTKIFKILAYGLERRGFSAPPSSLRFDNIQITFAQFDTDLKFQDFDGLIMFQGIWAGRMSGGWNHHDFKENDMMRTRIKQIQELEKKHGFVCILMDRLEYDDFDLAKDILNWYSVYSHSCGDRTFLRKIYFNEMANYFNSDYGVAKTYFTYYNEGSYRVIADTRSYEGDVAISIDETYFFIPCHIIKRDEKSIENLFRTLSPGLVTTFRKLNQELPKWAQEFKFTKEESLKKKEKIEEQLSEVMKEISSYDDFKKPLMLTGTLLKESTFNLLKNGIGLNVRNSDQGLEDLQLHEESKQKDEEEKIIAVIEVKGVNANVTREAINQIDAHKERHGLSKSFPGLLIVNTFIKNSNSIQDKEKTIEQEQINHAISMNVLIMRTLDVVRLYDLINSGSLNTMEVVKMITEEKGWIEVKDSSIIMHNQSK